MLIEVHAASTNQTPAALAQAVADAGLDGAIITVDSPDRWADFADAFDDAGLVPFLGLEIACTRGALVFVPRDTEDAALDDVQWRAPAGGHAIRDAVALVADLDGLLFTAHPYDRSGGDAPGDRIYQAKGLGGVVTRTGQGKPSWDGLADAYAEKYGIARLGSGGDRLGGAATVVPEGIETQAALLGALEAGLTIPVEFDDPAARKDRAGPPPRPPRRDDRRGGRDDRGGRGRDRGDRGGRGRDRGDRGGRGRDRGGRR